MTAEEIHKRLLKAQGVIAANHGQLRRNRLPDMTRAEHDALVSKAKDRVMVGDLMCVAAGIDKDLVRVTTELAEGL